MSDEVSNYSWHDVENACVDLVHKIAHSGFRPNLIAPVMWGAAIPCRLMMDIGNWDRSMCHPIFAKSYEKCKQGELSINIDSIKLSSKEENNNKNILVVEEIIDSGSTINKICEALINIGFNSSNIGVSSLVRRTLLPSYGNWPSKPYYGIKDDRWIIFPWDKQEYMRTLDSVK